MDIENYEIFVNAVQSGSISMAAAENGYTQSAVSYIFKALEKKCGFKLVHRSRDGISLTKFGEMLLPKFSAVIDADKELQYLIFQINNVMTGTVTLGCSSTIYKTFFLPIINKFHGKYPNIVFKIIDGSSDDTDRRLASGEIDMGIFPYQANINHSFVFIKDDPLLVLLPDHNMRYENRMFPIEDFAQYPFITSSLNDEFHILADCEARGIPMNVVLKTQDVYTAAYSVEAGLGVTVVPELSMRTKRDLHVNSACLSPTYSRRLCIYTREGERIDPVAQVFYDFCRSELPKIARE